MNSLTQPSEQEQPVVPVMLQDAVAERAIKRPWKVGLWVCLGLFVPAWLYLLSLQWEFVSARGSLELAGLALALAYMVDSIVFGIIWLSLTVILIIRDFWWSAVVFLAFALLLVPGGLVLDGVYERLYFPGIVIIGSNILVGFAWLGLILYLIFAHRPWQSLSKWWIICWCCLMIGTVILIYPFLTPH